MSGAVMQSVVEMEERRSIRDMFTGLPWWLSGKESACQCGRHGFKPWSEKTPNTMEQLKLVHPLKRSHHNEKHMHHS